jgi:hypothetical protein
MAPNKLPHHRTKTDAHYCTGNVPKCKRGGP